LTVDRRRIFFIAVVVAVLAAAAAAVYVGRRDKPGTEQSYCAAVRAGDNPEAMLLAAAEIDDPDQQIAALEKSAARLRKLRAAAPEDIRDKLASLARTTDALADALAHPESSDDPPSDNDEANAGPVVLGYTLQHCGVDWRVPDASAAPDASGSPASAAPN
jgi:hypothetical protein